MYRRQGFLLIELVVALVLFGLVICLVLQLVTDMVKLQTDIVTRTNMLYALCSIVEEGGGRALGGQAEHCLVTQNVQPLAKILTQQVDQAPSLRHAHLKRIMVQNRWGTLHRPLTTVVVDNG